MKTKALIVVISSGEGQRPNHAWSHSFNLHLEVDIIASLVGGRVSEESKAGIKTWMGIAKFDTVLVIVNDPKKDNEPFVLHRWHKEDFNEMTTIDKATFNDLKEFFLSWGLWPSAAAFPPGVEHELGNSNNEFIINFKCYERMCEEAQNKYGNNFRSFISRMVDGTNGEFYLNADYWDDVLYCWKDAS